MHTHTRETDENHFARCSGVQMAYRREDPLRARAREEKPKALEPQGIAALFCCQKVDGS